MLQTLWRVNIRVLLPPVVVHVRDSGVSRVNARQGSSEEPRRQAARSTRHETEIRRATHRDASAIAAVHVKAWQWAYGGVLPKSVLGNMPSSRREELWRETLLASAPATSRVWVAQRAGCIVGFAVTGAPQDAGYTEDTVEVHAIYQLREVARTGVACRMMARALDDARAGGFRLAILWVLATNVRARRFYERGGWRSDGEARTNMLGRFGHRELRYHLDLANGSPRKALYNTGCVGGSAPPG